MKKFCSSLDCHGESQAFTNMNEPWTERQSVELCLTQNFSVFDSDQLNNLESVLLNLNILIVFLCLSMYTC